MLIITFIFKIMNNERKILTHHQIFLFAGINSVRETSAIFPLRYAVNTQTILIDEEQTKMKKETGIMLITTFIFKIMNNERKILTHHEIIDCVACRTNFVHVQRIKIADLPKLTTNKFPV